ncbi:MAG: Hsp70 family protein [Microlunatus sp.]
MLFIADDGGLVVGEPAERRGTTDPGRLVREFKRRLGDHVPLLVGGAAYSAEMLMGRMLRWVVDATSSQLGAAPETVICSRPANWGRYKQELFDQVIGLAELSHVQQCTEPEAAAAQYAARSALQAGERIAVYDLGGGTFDVCVLEKTVEGFRLLGSPDGVEHLGGVDFDEALNRSVLEMLDGRLPELESDDPATIVGLARLRRDCVEAKEQLSSELDATVQVALPGLNTMVRLTRRDLETAIRPALADTVVATRRALRSAEIDPHQLTAIVLVGGSSRIPMVSELLQHEFGVPVALDTHPKHDIALGAARLSRSVQHKAKSSRASGSATARSSVAGKSTVGYLNDPDYQAAVSAISAGRFAEAVARLEALATRYPGKPDITDRLQNAQRELRYADLTADLATAKPTRNWVEVVAILEEMDQLKPGQIDLNSQLNHARHRARSDELLGRIQASHAARDWQGVITAGKELGQVDPVAVPNRLVEEASYHLETIDLDRQYADAIRALDNNDWAAAAQRLEHVQTRRPNHRDTLRLLTLARQHLANMSAMPVHPPSRPPGGQVYPAPQSSRPAQNPGQAMGIVGLVLSIFCSVVGMIVSIVAYHKSKAAGFKNGIAVAGIVVGAVMLVFTIIGMFMQ